MKKIVFILFLFTLNVFSIEIKLAQSSKKASARELFWTDMLKFVLDYSKVEYKMSVTYEMTQSRIIRELETNSGKINLHVMGTSSELEKKLLPIHIPITRGLAGYRLFIIHKENQYKFEKIATFEELQDLQGLQGFGWSDIEILNHSGLHQREMEYERIFDVINNKKADYFSRSLHEAFEEVEEHQLTQPNLAVEQNLLLIYPFALLAFTNNENRELAHIIEKAFIKAYDDGVFLPYFYTHPHIKNALKESNFQERKILRIPNPFLSNETKTIDERYWHKEKSE